MCRSARPVVSHIIIDTDGMHWENVRSGHQQAASIGILLRERQWTLVVAESCTGGGLGWALTDVPGSSEYFAGGVIAYSNAVKKDFLGVPDDVLQRFGAVSAECARAMADGARRLFSADLGVSVTGIAGPTGATASKPVGLVFVGLATPGWCDVHEFRFSGSRSDVRDAAVNAALSLIREKLTTDGD